VSGPSKEFKLARDELRAAVSAQPGAQLLAGRSTARIPARSSKRKNRPVHLLRHGRGARPQRLQAPAVQRDVAPALALPGARAARGLLARAARRVLAHRRGRILPDAPAADAQRRSACSWRAQGAFSYRHC